MIINNVEKKAKKMTKIGQEHYQILVFGQNISKKENSSNDYVA